MPGPQVAEQEDHLLNSYCQPFEEEFLFSYFNGPHKERCRPCHSKILLPPVICKGSLRPNTGQTDRKKTRMNPRPNLDKKSKLKNFSYGGHP